MAGRLIPTKISRKKLITRHRNRQKHISGLFCFAPNFFRRHWTQNRRVKNPIPIYYLGSECKPTIDGMILYKNPKDDNKWKTEFEADSFTKSDGTKVTKDELEKILYSPGDGVVPKRSLISSLLSLGKFRNLKSGIVGNDLTLACGEHNRLAGDSDNRQKSFERFGFAEHDAERKNCQSIEND